MESIRFLVIVLLTMFAVCGCASPMKKPALDAITQARLDIAAAKDNANVRNEKLSLKDAKSTLKEAELSFNGKDYDDAKSYAESASVKAKSTVTKAKESKEAKEKKAIEEKKPPVKKLPKKQ